jgi:hypothetical protein
MFAELIGAPPDEVAIVSRASDAQQNSAAQQRSGTTSSAIKIKAPS